MKNTSRCLVTAGGVAFVHKESALTANLKKKIYLEYFLKSNLSTIHMKTHEQIPGMKLQSQSTLPPRLYIYIYNTERRCTSRLLQRKHTVGNCCETRKKKAILHAYCDKTCKACWMKYITTARQ